MPSILVGRMASARPLLFLLTAALLVGGCITRVKAVPPVEVCDHIRDRADRETCVSRVEALASPQEAGKTGSSVPVRSSFPWFVYALWWGAYYGVGLIIARWIFIDARTRDWLAFRIPPLWWSVICIVDPAFGILVYWLIHYSRLGPRYPDANNKTLPY